MSTECPHCYVRVFPDRDGVCPSCLENVLDLSGTDPTKTTVLVNPNSKMPDVCCNCGLPTRRFVKVKSYGARGVETAPSESGRILLILLEILFLPFFLVLPKDTRSRRGHVLFKRVVSVPQCRMCSGNKIAPVQEDHDQGTMSLVVDREFKERFQRVDSENE